MRMSSPRNAISDIKEGSKSSGGTISSASFYIDPAKINPGTTWLEIYLRSNNTSSDGTLFVKITVLPEGGSIEVETWTETIVFDISSSIDMTKEFHRHRQRLCVQHRHRGETTVHARRIYL